MIDWSGIEDWIVSLPAWLMLLLVFLAAFIEGIPVLGIPFPGNLVVSAVAIQAGLARHNPTPLLAVHALGGLVADVLFYSLGRRYGLGFLVGFTERLPPWLRYDATREGQLKALLDAHGVKTIILARMSPGIRNTFAWAAGALRLRFLRMLVGAVTGGVATSAFFVASGYLVGRGYEEAGEILGKGLTYTIVGIIVALALGYFLTRRLRLATPRTLVLAFGVLAAIPAFIALLRGHVRVGLLRTWEEQGGRLFAGSGLDALDVPRWLTSSEPMLGGLIVLFLWLAVRSRWRESLGVATTAGLAVAAVVALHAVFPRPMPDGASIFPLAPGFADMTAMLAVLLTAFVAAHVMRGTTTFGGKLALGAVWTLGTAFALAPALLGRSYLSDVLAGVALGAAAACIGLLADVLAKNLILPPAPDHLGGRLVQHFRAGADRILATFAAVAVRPGAAWSLVAFGVAARIIGPWTWALGPDATRYAAMAKGFLDTGSFLMPWGDVYTPGAAGMSHHYPPLFPLVLAGFYKVFGFSEDTTRLASIVLALAAMLVVYLTTRDLYGKVPARIVLAIVAVSPILIQTTNKGYAENLVLLLFAASLWGILKSLDKPWFIVWGGLFAALAYLTKSSMGYFFIVAGLGGLAWRLYWKGWKVLRQVPYLVAIVVFGTAVLAWGYRNWDLFGDWQTSTHLRDAYTTSWQHPLDWLHLLPWSFAVMFGLGYLLFMGVMPWLPRLASIPRMKSEHDSGLWLALGLPVVLTVAIDSALWNLERDFYLHNVRYVSFAIVPLAWLLVRHAQPSRQTWIALGLTLGIFVAGTLYYASVPNVPVQAYVSDELGRLVEDGDSLAFVDTNDVYRAYFDVTRSGQREIAIAVFYGEDARNATQDWVMASGLQPDLPPGYALVEHLGPQDAGYTIWRKDAASA